MTYTIPFEMPEDCPAVDLVDILIENNVKIMIDTNDDFIITGTMESLIGFHRELDGPGVGFPVDEFKDYVRSSNLV
tara:strand:- start:3171 stop:3398 length:228 start_codon:yes stop_codon:yes gene_type:complete